MVLLVGATGRLGSRIARELLSTGTSVRALCRPASGYTVDSVDLQGTKDLIDAAKKAGVRFAFDTSALAQEFGVQQTPLEPWVRAALATSRPSV